MNHDRAFVDGLIDLIEQRMVKANKAILTLSEAAIYTGLSISTLHSYCHKKMIPYSKPTNRLVYFLKSDLDAWMLRNKVKSDEQIMSNAIKNLA